MNKKIVIFGGSGYIGRRIAKRFKDLGYRVLISSRDKQKLKDFNDFEFFYWDVNNQSLLSSILEDANIIINLIGEPIFQRFTKKAKERIWNSRILSNQKIVEEILKTRYQDKVFISASAIGYYGNRGDEILTEDSSPGTDFLAELCQNWEKAVFPLSEHNVRTIILRFGIVLGKNSQIIKNTLPLFQKGLEINFTNGKEWVSWVHIDDIVKAVEFLVGSDVDGVFNITSPNPCLREDFNKAFWNNLNKKPKLKINLPKFFAYLIFGRELTNYLITSSQKVLPKRLLNLGFNFTYKEINETIKYCIG
jgi:uncharacterized protein (TIGR01777 family)